MISQLENRMIVHQLIRDDHQLSSNRASDIYRQKNLNSKIESEYTMEIDVSTSIQKLILILVLTLLRFIKARLLDGMQ